MRVFNYLSAIILSGLTLSLILLPYLTPERAGNLIFISLLAIPILLADGIALVISLWKRKRCGVLYLLLLLGSLPVLSGYCPFHRWGQAEHPLANRLALICWNTEGFQLNKDTLAKAAQAIQAHQPDLICLQERPHTNLLAWDTLQAAFPAYPYRVTNSREDEVLNLALFSRWPIERVQESYFPDSFNKILQVDLRMEEQIIRLFNVHLQTTGMNGATIGKKSLQAMRRHAIQRNCQADLLAKAIAESPYPVIVCGDFNDTPASYAYRRVSRQLQDGYLRAGKTWKGSYQRWGNWLRIDYVLSSPLFRVNRYQLISNPWSDHKLQHCVLSWDSRS